MDPTVPLTNGMLLDLYRFSKLAESAGRRVVDLLHALGYEAKSTCPKGQEKMWSRRGRKLIEVAQKNHDLKKEKLAKHLATIRNDCIQPVWMKSPVNLAAVSFNPAASVRPIHNVPLACRLLMLLPN